MSETKRRKKFAHSVSLMVQRDCRWVRLMYRGADDVVMLSYHVAVMASWLQMVDRPGKIVVNGKEVYLQPTGSRK